MATPEQIAELEAYYATRTDPGRAKGLAAINQDRPLARLQGNAAPILARLASGEKLVDVARQMGITSVALGTWLLEYAAEEYRAISAGRALARLQAAEDSIEDATDRLDVAKGRELGKLAGWQLERLSKQYAANKDQNTGVNITVNVDRSCDGSITVDQG